MDFNAGVPMSSLSPLMNQGLINFLPLFLCFDLQILNFFFLERIGFNLSFSLFFFCVVGSDQMQCGK